MHASCRKEPAEVVYQDLLSDRKSVEVIRSTGCVDLGTPASLEHLAGHWQIEPRKTKDGSNFFVAHSKNVFLFDSGALEDQRLAIRWKLQSSKPQYVKVLINEQPLEEREIAVQWLRHEWIIPRKYLRLGENILHLESTGRHLALAIDSICVGGPSDGVPPSSAMPLTVPLNSVVPLYLRVPENGLLRVEFGIDKKQSTWRAAARFEIWVEEDGIEPYKLHTQTIEQGLFFSPSESATLDLSRFSGKRVRIRMIAFPVKGQKKPAAVYWQKAQLSFDSSIREERIPLKRNDSSDAKTIVKKPRNIFFYLIDTLRADHLQPYGYSRASSPRIFEFARDAVLFENAYAQSTWTRSSVACIQTGLYQSSHLVESRDDVLRQLPTLQRTLKSNQFFTMGIVTNANLIPRFQLANGFEIYNLISGSKKRPGISPHSGQVYDLAEHTLRENKHRQPFYMYVHVMDPHQPYAPEIGSPENRIIPECKSDPKGGDCSIARYDGEVYNSDYYFGKFVDLIKQMGLYEDSLIILTADHGESLGEHDAAHHGTTLYNSEISVPLILKFPGKAFAGKRISAPVGHIDLFPTVLSLLSLPIPPGVQGQSLIPILEDSRSDHRQIFAEILLDDADKKAIVEGHHKVIATTFQNKLTGRAGTYYEMYDLMSDPHELRDIHFEKPVLFGYMKSRLNKWAAQQAARKATLKKPQGAELDEETKELLRALGYVQ